MIPQLIAASAKLNIGLKKMKCSPPTNGIHASYLQATVACTIGSLNIERRYRIYADCPAIACDTYLKGQVELYQNKEDNRSNADRKNIEHTADMATGV